MKLRQSQFPREWEIKKLGEVCTIRPPKKEAKEKLNESELVTFLPMEDLGILTKDFNSSKVRKLKEVARSYTYFAENDLLLAKITPCFENGKIGIARNLTNEIGFGSSEYDNQYAWSRILNNVNDQVFRGYANKRDGFSIRCLKDYEKSIIINDVTVNEGQPLEVPISVSELTSADNTISYQFDVTFDNTTLEYTGNNIIGTLAAGGTVDVNTGVAGKLSVGYITSTALVAAGNILKLQFNTLKADTVTLTLSNAYLNSTLISNLIPGTIIVKDVTPPTGAVTYNDSDVRFADALTITATFNEPMLLSNAVKLSLSGAATLANAEMTR